MGDEQDRPGFEALAQAGADDDEDAARSLTARLKAEPDTARLKALAALWLHAAAASPEGLVRIYDGAAEGWLGEPVAGPQVRTMAGLRPAPIPPAFWTALWSLVSEGGGLASAGVTSRTAALSGLIAAEVLARVAKAAQAFPGVAASGQAATLEKRIDEAAPVWRRVAGYEATALHEVAFCAFQLAQTGGHYPAKYLAMVLTRVAFEQPAGGPLMLQTILTAWTHGRRTPALINALWRSVPEELEAMRKRLGVTPYASPFPADLLERAAA